jgi:hypothetical protein
VSSLVDGFRKKIQKLMGVCSLKISEIDKKLQVPNPQSFRFRDSSRMQKHADLPEYVKDLWVEAAANPAAARFGSPPRQL